MYQAAIHAKPVCPATALLTNPVGVRIHADGADWLSATFIRMM